MSDKIIIGIPNKGRLQEKTFNLFMKSGLEIIRNHGDREYYGKMDGIDNVDVVFLSPREISMELCIMHCLFTQFVYPMKI